MKYISYKESKIAEKERNENNKKYIELKIKKEKEYFKNMFKDIDENIKLDEEQQKIILTDDDYVLVIAGAGSGKTTTITAKTKYLIEKQNITPEEIVIISFTNKAVNELKERINIQFKYNVKITTFHKFGYEIIKQNQTNYPKIIKDNRYIIEKYINHIIKQEPKTLKKLYTFYSNYFESREQQIPNKYKTLNGEYTETINQKIIADHLYIKGIKYKYKKQYKYNKQYIPDFTIEQNNKEYYIEYIDITPNEKIKYIKHINKIKKIHNKHKTTLLIIYKTNELNQIKNKLKKYKIIGTPIPLKTIFNEKIKQNKTYEKFITLCSTYISLYKAKGYDENDFEKITTHNTKQKIFNIFIKKLYKYIEQYNKNKNQIDFDDIINKAIKIINPNNQTLKKYKYIIIDEYQDISENRFKLIKKISDIGNSKIMLVGDDWQCIYSFASSNINLFTQIKKYIKHCEILKIQNTYRNSQELIDIAGEFIKKNPNQINKTLKSTKRIKYPITILKYKKTITNKLIKAINYLIKKYGEEKNILILGRYNEDINKINENQILKKDNNKIIIQNNKKTKIEFMTVHSAKGLGYDNVIILNTLDDILGFPSKIEPDPILQQLIEKENTKVEYPEERRLFYVALTRTKNEIIILEKKNQESIFIKEIKKNKNIKIKSNI